MMKPMTVGENVIDLGVMLAKRQLVRDLAAVKSLMAGLRKAFNALTVKNCLWTKRGRALGRDILTCYGPLEVVRWELEHVEDEFTANKMLHAIERATSVLAATNVFLEKQK